MKVIGGKKVLLALASTTLIPCAMIATDTTNLVANGSFEIADPANAAKPLAWELPDGLGIQWDKSPDGDNHAIRMDTSVSETAMVESWQKAGLSETWDIPNPAPNAIAETYGLSYYSDAFPVVSGKTYRVSCRLRGGVGTKVWVRGYGMFRGKMRRRYEVVLHGETRNDAWTTNSLVFHPTRQRPDVTEVKVMLYAYYPPGIQWFDDVVVEEVDDEETTDSPIAQ